MFWVLGLLACAALIVWGVIALLHSPLLAVTNITVSGERYVSVEQIKRMAAIPRDQSTVLMDSDEVEARILKNPWMAEATVTKRIPHTVAITVVERVPAVSLMVEEDCWVAASDGMWLGLLLGCGHEDLEGAIITDPFTHFGNVSVEGASVIPVEGIPDLTPTRGSLTTDESLKNVLALLRGLDPAIIAQVERVVAPDTARTSLFTKDGVEIDIGLAKDLPEKSRIIQTILTKHADEVVLINVRSIEKPTWRGLSQ